MSRSLRDERGVTILLVAFLLVGILGLLAIAVDLPRLMLSRNQLQLAADAGALAASVTVLRGDTLAGYDSAVAYALANKADTAAMAEDSAVVFGVWDPALREFDSRLTPWGTNAIRVRAHGTGNNLVAWVLGAATSDASATAIAVFSAGVTETTCVKPIAVGLEVFDTDNDGVISQAERDAALGVDMIIKPAENPADAPSFYYALVLPPFWDASTGEYVSLPPGAMGGAALRQNIGNCNPDLVGVGDSLYTKPGATFGPMRDGFEDLCGEIQSGTDLCNPSGAYSDDGLPGIPIVAPLWDTDIAPIGRSTVEVTDIVAFRLTHVDIIGGGKIELRGFPIRMLDSGASDPGVVGFIERPLLVR